jgi:methylated-DNA-[protein]-cysteine S-methyltransferase
MIGISVVEAPWGPVHIAADARGVVGLEVLTGTGAFIASVQRRRPTEVVARAPEDLAAPAARRHLRAAADAVEAYLDGRPDALDELPFVLDGLASWDRLVLQGVRSVPWGELTSYGRLARQIGRPGAARAVGGAVGRNPIGLVVPCHRVIAGDGSIGGYGGSWFGDREVLLGIKRELLAHEGSSLGGSVAWTTFAGHDG